MSKNNRRKALKVLAVTAPAVWAKPVIRSVVLPAHAATSSTCSGRFCIRRETNDGGSNFVLDDRLNILFDGTGCSFQQFESSQTTPETGGNLILQLDLDTPASPEGEDPVIVGCGDENFDIEESGDTNWDVSHSIASNGNLPGTYSATATRSTEPGTGNTYDITISYTVGERVLEPGSNDCGDIVGDDFLPEYTVCFDFSVSVERTD